MIGEAWSNDSLRISGIEAVIVAVFSAYCTMATGWLSSAYRAEKSGWLLSAYCVALGGVSGGS